MPAKLPPKKDVAIALLQGPSVYVHIDPRKDGVAVPQWFKKQHQLVLQVGINMAVPIHDLDVSDEGIGGTLSFSRDPHWCFMPWTAIYALVGEDGRGMIWPEDVPSELAAQQKRPALSVVGSKKSKPKPTAAAKGTAVTELGVPKPIELASKRPHLAAVVDDDADTETEPAQPSDPPSISDLAVSSDATSPAERAEAPTDPVASSEPSRESEPVADPAAPSEPVAGSEPAASKDSAAPTEPATSVELAAATEPAATEPAATEPAAAEPAATEPAEDGAGPRDSTDPPAKDGDKAAGEGGKRELPPYLRVIK
jgi:stringent starvation protein B